MKYPQTLNNLIECFKKLPGIGEKSAERMALSILDLDEDVIDVFSDTLKNIKKKIKKCKECNNYSEQDLCDICKSTDRNKKVICVALSASQNINNEEYLDKLKYVIEKSEFFSVRDSYTKQYLEEKLGKEISEKIVEKIGRAHV